MRTAAVLAVAGAAMLVNAQGYNSTTQTSSTTHHASTRVYDSRTVNVPPPSISPTTALTSIYTITSTCGTVKIFLPATSVYPLSTRTTSTFTGSSTGSAAKTQVAAAGGLVAAAAVLLF